MTIVMRVGYGSVVFGRPGARSNVPADVAETCGRSHETSMPLVRSNVAASTTALPHALVISSAEATWGGRSPAAMSVGPFGHDASFHVAWSQKTPTEWPPAAE